MKTQLINQYHEVYLSGTWVANTNLRRELLDTRWEEAKVCLHNANSIEALAFHLNYYIEGVGQVLDGGSLDIKDKFSFDLIPAQSVLEWKETRARYINNLEQFAIKLDNMPVEKLTTGFVQSEYGTYHRNIQVIIEHGYYHLGQIVLLKKMIRGFGSSKKKLK